MIFAHGTSSFAVFVHLTLRFGEGKVVKEISFQFDGMSVIVAVLSDIEHKHRFMHLGQFVGMRRFHNSRSWVCRIDSDDFKGGYCYGEDDG